MKYSSIKSCRVFIHFISYYPFSVFKNSSRCSRGGVTHWTTTIFSHYFILQESCWERLLIRKSIGVQLKTNWIESSLISNLYGQANHQNHDNQPPNKVVQEIQSHHQCIFVLTLLCFNMPLTKQWIHSFSKNFSQESHFSYSFCCIS